VVGFCLLIPAFRSATGEDKPPVSAPKHLASDLVALSRLVMEHHFQPPARQQVILAAARGLYESREQEPPADLAQQCSEAKSDSEFEAILNVAWGADVGVDPTRDAQRLQAAVFRMSSVIPGDLTIESLKSHTANRQLAENRYVGVGIAVRMTMTTEISEFQVTSALEGGPMKVAGIPDNTVITEIDGWKTTGQRLEECVERLRGPEGSTVSMLIRRPDSTTIELLTIRRGVVPIKSLQFKAETIQGRSILGLSPGRLTGSLPHEIREAINAQPKIDGIVLDLRSTESGPAHFAVLLADQFLRQGTIGGERRDGKLREFKAEPGELAQDVPLAILVDEQCDGTCEWLAAILVESGRAQAFGTPTAGLAVDAESFPLPSGNLVARFSTLVLETPKHEKLLGKVSIPTQVVKALPSQHRKQRPVGVYAGRLIPQVVEPKPVTLSSIATTLLQQATVKSPRKGTAAMMQEPGREDAMNAAIEYLVRQPLQPLPDRNGDS
jgi:carboxyl-terminal processing protease